nr:hypothetical protein [uncultured Cellulosilyticum sp.]
MDIKELDRLAKENKPMPERLAMYEQCYYIASRGLYRQYDTGDITLEQAKAEKSHVVKQYQEGKQQWQLFISLYEIQDKLQALQKDGFNTALEMEILALIDKTLEK